MRPNFAKSPDMLFIKSTTILSKTIEAWESEKFCLNCQMLTPHIRLYERVSAVNMQPIGREWCTIHQADTINRLLDLRLSTHNSSRKKTTTVLLLQYRNYSK